jgi:pantothenate kinase
MDQQAAHDNVLRSRLAEVEELRARALSEAIGKSNISVNDAAVIIARKCRAGRPHRIVAGVCGFPASGKTTMAKWVVGQLNEHYGPGYAAHLPMDGFHYRNSRLERDGLDGIKGDISTYDVNGLVEKLSEVRRHGHSTILAPDYVREMHEVRESAIEIPASTRAVVVEGIYIGYTDKGGAWSKVRTLLDVLFYLNIGADVCVERIIARNRAVGRGEEMIKRKLWNDFYFMKRAINVLREADYIVYPSAGEDH